MVTYEDVTGLFLKAAASLLLVTHPEHWTNSRSLEREFSCTCHVGSCEEAETHSSCTIAFTWGPLDTALSLEGPAGVCDFFHESTAPCPHLHTRAIPPLVLNLTYTLPLTEENISADILLSLIQMLRLRASENSRRTIETQPGVTMILQNQQLKPDMLTLQQRVELPIWHPEGLRGLHDTIPGYPFGQEHSHLNSREDGGEMDTVIDAPHPETWLPQIMFEVCQDILSVIDAMEAAFTYNRAENM